MTSAPDPFSLPPDLQQALLQAIEFRKGGRPAEAAALYRRYLPQYPQHPVLLGQLGELLMQQGDFQAALPLLEQAKQVAPGQAPHWLLLTQCLLQLGRPKEAKKVITEAISKGLRHPLADELLRQARSWHKRKQQSEKLVPLNEALRQIEALFQAGRYAEAETLGRELQRRHARVPRLDYLLGSSALMQGHFKDALQPLRRAVEIDPRLAPAWFNLGYALERLERLDEALAAYRRAVSVAPQLAEAHNNLGNVLQKLKRHTEAVSAYEAALALRPETAQYHMNRGDALRDLDRLEDAEAAYQAAIRLKPDMAEVYLNLGYVLHLQGRSEASAKAFQHAIDFRQDYVEAYQGMGHALRGMDQYEEAEAAYRRALEFRPGDVGINVDLGRVLKEACRYEAALEPLQQALAIKPDSDIVFKQLADTLQRMGHFEEAEAAFRRALDIKSDDIGIYIDLGKALKEACRYEAALEILQQALAIKPDSETVSIQLAGTLLDMGRHDEALDTYRRGLVLDPDGFFYMHSNLLLALNYQAGATPRQMLDEARAFGGKTTRRAVPFKRHGNEPDPDRRLRIGLVSGDLGQHPVGFFLQNLLENLDPTKLEVFAYETSRRKDALNQRLRHSVHQWHDANRFRMPNEALANRIRDDGIDILIDLAGHTGNNRLPVFAWKPAPVQVTWLGYLGTTGLDAMDYVLADAWALPAGEEDQFTEIPWRMPESYICFSPPDLPVEVGPLPAREKGYITFGCFNNLSKINDQVLACWARILQSAPGARLYLKTKYLGGAEAREKLVESFARFGIAQERLILDGQFASHEAHFQAYHKVDIALDPFPYPGITTTVEALWMGVPVLSMRGQRFISHQGETILHNAGLPEWIATNVDDYVAKAAAFAGDMQALAKLRAGLRTRLLASPLCDAPRFARNFEDAMRGMWQKWCGQQQSANAAD